MDNDSAAGTPEQAKGSVQEAIGKITGDTETDAEGAAERTEGKVRNSFGCATALSEKL